MAVKIAINDRWNSSASMHLSRKTYASLDLGMDENNISHMQIFWRWSGRYRLKDQKSDFLTPEQWTIHHYCGSGSYLPVQISRCLVDKAITIIALSANTITLGMSTPQHNWGPSFLSDVVVVILQRILCVAHCLCQLQGRSGGKNVNDVILSHIYILHSLRSPSQRPNVKHKIEQSRLSHQNLSST